MRQVEQSRIPGDKSAAVRDLFPTDLVQEEKEPGILNSSTNSKRSELSIETVSRQRDNHRLYPRLTNIVRLSNYVARIHSSHVTSNYQGTAQYHTQASRFQAPHGGRTSNGMSSSSTPIHCPSRCCLRPRAGIQKFSRGLRMRKATMILLTKRHP